MIRTRPVLVDLAVLEDMQLRTDDGRRIEIEWGNPNAQGIYEPTLTTHADDGLILVRRSVLDNLQAVVAALMTR
jgi:hypothetical protein